MIIVRFQADFAAFMFVNIDYFTVLFQTRAYAKDPQTKRDIVDNNKCIAIDQDNDKSQGLKPLLL